MNPIRRPSSGFHLLIRLAVGLLLLAPWLATAGRAADADSELKLVVILTRHGVRSPLRTNEQLGQYSAEPWPAWSVAPGILTPHGKQEMLLMGAYYRMRLIDEGLLTGRVADDLPRIYFRSDSDQRTMETARDLAAGLVPGTDPDPHALPHQQADPLFQPVKLNLGSPDRNAGVAAVLGRVGHDPANVIRANRAAFLALQQVLLGPSGVTPAGKINLLDLPSEVQPGKLDHTVGFEGPLHVAEQIVDALILEYAEGLPMSQVGWGRLSPETLTQLIQLHALHFDLVGATFYPAQVQGSNLSSHLLDTLDQAATGQARAGAFGHPGQNVVVVVGHDTNIANLGGLLGLGWWLPGTQANPVLPGGALVFELRQRRSDGKKMVRTYYVSQTLLQTRELSPLTLEHPPALAPIYVPNCSEPGPTCDVPLEKFTALLRRVIDPRYVVPGAP